MRKRFSMREIDYKKFSEKALDGIWSRKVCFFENLRELVENLELNERDSIGEMFRRFSRNIADVEEALKEKNEEKFKRNN